MKLPRGSPRHLTSSQRLQERTSRTLRENELKIFDLYRVFENIEVPDKAWDDVRGL